MNITYRKKFIKLFKKLQKNEQIKIKKSISLFLQNIFDPQINNHSLKGEYKGCRSINAGGLHTQ